MRSSADVYKGDLCWPLSNMNSLYLDHTLDMQGQCAVSHVMCVMHASVLGPGLVTCVNQLVAMPLDMLSKSLLVCRPFASGGDVHQPFNQS